MRHFYVIGFDVADKTRLRKVAIQMENFGQRIQHSMFECYLNQQEIITLKKRLKHIIEPTKDHIRYYPLCHKDYQKIQLDGIGEVSPNDDFHFV